MQNLYLERFIFIPTLTGCLEGFRLPIARRLLGSQVFRVRITQELAR